MKLQSLDTGASPATVAAWIAETEGERARHEIASSKARMTEDQIESIIAELADIAVTLRDADPDDNSEVYQQLGLKLTCHPVRQVVRRAIDLNATGRWFFEVSEGGLEPPCPFGALAPQASASAYSATRTSADRGGCRGPAASR